MTNDFPRLTSDVSLLGPVRQPSGAQNSPWIPHLCFMEDDIYEIPVQYRGQELLVPAQLLVTGYTHKFRVEVSGHEVLFEPDEERNYRAMLDPAHGDSAKIDVELLKAIAAGIEAAVK